MITPTFSVNRYDRTILSFKSSVELEQFANSIIGMLPEIRDNEY